jgi:hypothetical protein
LQSPLLASDSGNFDVIKTSVFESPHPYLDSSDVTHMISCAGAARMEVSFDPRSATVSSERLLVTIREPISNDTRFAGVKLRLSSIL